MERPAAVECVHVASGYGSALVMPDVHFSIRPGEIFFILGGSGCGKSTLLKHMIGLEPPLGGDIRLFGESIVAAEGAARQRLLRSFGMMYQQGALFGNLTVLENVCLPLEEFSGLPAALCADVARRKLAQVGLLAQAEAMPASLSGGQCKRAAIARAMALDPKLLFLDEPSAGLDPVTSAGLDALIVRLSRTLGMTVVIVSHELASIEAIADRAVYLDRSAGGVLAAGAPAALRESEHPAVRAFFRREAERS